MLIRKPPSLCRSALGIGPRQTPDLPPQKFTHTDPVELVWQVEMVTEKRTEHARQHQRTFAEGLPVLRARQSGPRLRAAKQKHIGDLLARCGPGERGWIRRKLRGCQSVEPRTVERVGLCNEGRAQRVARTVLSHEHELLRHTHERE